MNEPAHRAEAAVPAGDAVPLCVDLDGTVLRTDLLWESLVALLRSRPWRAALAPLWLCRGMAHLKARLAREARPGLSALPVDEEFLDWVRREAAGRPIWLVSGSHHSLVRRMSRCLGGFAGAAGTRRGINLTGAAKARWLCGRFGAGRFDYAGDRAADLGVWRHARKAYIVRAPAALAQRVAAVAAVGRVWPRPCGRWRAWLGALRLHQWVKNLIVFAPILTSHRWLEAGLVPEAALAFAAFSLLASALYIVNDLLDLDSDRIHPDKSGRPLACGDLSIPMGLAAVPLLMGGAAGIALLLPGAFRAALAAYGVISLGYSALLKRWVLVDALALTVLYLLRIWGGGSATGIGVSSWLMAFAMFLFLSLALAKRYAELKGLRALQRSNAAGRGYAASHLSGVGFLGMASGLVSVLVAALYIGSPAAALIYGNPALLWPVCLLLIFWVGRLWLINRRGDLHEDPVLFVIRDPASYLVGAAIAALLLLAR